ncbi:MAG: LuxR family transcriptional regulator [Chitinophagaceae bacterium]|nr:MAG: LuxR family transcriptional regulator [Chitinophagaceae bacterium]
MINCLLSLDHAKRFHVLALAYNNAKPTLSFIGLHGESSYINFDSTKKYSAARNVFPRRESEILALLLLGHQSAEIADKLFISKHTVDTHRKKLLSKTNANQIWSWRQKSSAKG